MKALFTPIILFGMILLSACGAAGPDAGAPVADAASAALQEMTITATAEGWDAPEAAPAGWTSITLNNESDGLRQAAFLRLEDDKTMDDVFAAIEAGMEEPEAWMVPLGGVSGVSPGDRATVSVNLAAGQYIVVDPVPTEDGVPGMAKGYFMPLAVEENDAETSAPAADLDIDLVDYAFEVDYDALSAGEHTIKVSNSSSREAHEVVFVKLDEGATVGDFLAAFSPEAPGGPLPGEFIGGTAAFVGESDNYLTVELEEGASYGIICFLPSPANQGQTHFMLGMVGEFTAQ